MLKFICLVGLLVFASCSHKLQPTIETTVKDSIIYQIKEKIVNVPGATVTVHDTIKCVNDFPLDFAIEKKVGRAEIKAKSKKGVLTVDCKCDSIVAKVRDSIKSSFHFKTVTKIVPKIEYRTYGFDKFCRWFTFIAFALLGVYLYQKFKPSILGLIKKLL